jgi:hypothetical protein
MMPRSRFSPAGPETVKQWGADGPRLVGPALDKFCHLERSLPAAERMRQKQMGKIYMLLDLTMI